MYEEEISLLEQRFGRDEVSRQEKLILKHFGNIEEKIRQAGSKAGAERVCAQEMEAFERECISEILPEFMRHYLESLVERYWHAEDQS